MTNWIMIFLTFSAIVLQSPVATTEPDEGSERCEWLGVCDSPGK